IEFGPVLPPEGESDELIRPRASVTLESLTINNLFQGFQKTLLERRKELGEARFRELLLGLRRTGFRLNPILTDRIFSYRRPDNPDDRDWRFFPVEGLGNDLNRLFQAESCPKTEVNFLYNIIDHATGRELQSKPIHNLAGLGIANGDRPFRFFPQPIVFAPRSVILVQISEVSGTGRLYFVLQGYKVLGTASQPRE
ncbi:MAG: hypothetical protein ACRENG_37640, partial [bacterium]